MKLPDQNRETHSVDVAAQRLGVSRAAAYRAAQAGELPVIRIGRRLVVPRAALDALLATGSRTGQQKTVVRR